MLYIAGSSDPRILLWLSKQISFLSKRFPSLSIFWLHWDMSPYCVWVQFVCSCTLFLLFCQGHQGSESTETYRKQKANGTFMSSMETYSEHAYTLPLLAACRLASSSFGMDHGASESAATATPNTHLHKFDWVLGAGSVLAYLTMISTIPRTDASCAPVEDSPWGFFLQFSLFTILASVYLVQVRFLPVFAHTGLCDMCGNISFLHTHTHTHTHTQNPNEHVPTIPGQVGGHLTILGFSDKGNHSDCWMCFRMGLPTGQQW